MLSDEQKNAIRKTIIKRIGESGEEVCRAQRDRFVKALASMEENGKADTYEYADISFYVKTFDALTA